MKRRDLLKSIPFFCSLPLTNKIEAQPEPEPESQTTVADSITKALAYISQSDAYCKSILLSKSDYIELSGDPSLICIGGSYCEKIFYFKGVLVNPISGYRDITPFSDLFPPKTILIANRGLKSDYRIDSSLREVSDKEWTNLWK